MDLTLILLVGFLSFLIAGTIKGVVGIGLPSMAIALMVTAIAPRDAIALVMFPMIAANILQSARAGAFLQTVRRYWLFGVILCAGVTASTFLTKDSSDQWLLFAIAVAMVIFVLASWRNFIPKLPQKYDQAAQVFFALLSGIIGGMTAAWGPPMAMYLMTRDVPKEEFIRATGFLIIVGSLPLTISYLSFGFLDKQLGIASLAMIIPTFLGFFLGERIRTKLSVAAFKNVVLVLFALLALNLFRRAFMGG